MEAEVSALFNYSIRKVGGIWFIKVGRLNLSFSVTSWEAIERKLEAELVHAVDMALWWDPELNS